MTNHSHALPAPRPHFPGPTEPRDDAIERQNRTIENHVLTAARRVARRTHRGPEAAGPPQPPLFVSGGQGTGKTTVTLSVLSRVLADMQAPIVVWVLLPTLAKAEEALDDLREEARRQGRLAPPAMVLRGRGAAVPDADEAETMCARAELAEKLAKRGLPVGPFLCRSCSGGGEDEAEAVLCPSFGDCAYQTQLEHLRAMKRGIVIMTHSYAVTGAPGPRPDLVVIDESMLDRVAWRHSLSSDLVAEGPTEEATPLRAYAKVGPRIVEAFRETANLEHLRRHLTAQDLRAAREELEEARRPWVLELRPDMPNDEIREQLDAAPRNEHSRLIDLLNAILAEFDREAPTFNRVWSEVGKAGAAGHRRWINVGGLRELQLDPEADVLLLDGTGDADFNRRLFSDDLVHVHAPVPRDARAIQCHTRLFSRQSLTGRNMFGGVISETKEQEARQLRQEIVTLARRLPGPVLVATYKQVAEILREEGLPQGGDVAHFGALRGRNCWKDHRTVVLVGRQQPPPEVMEAAVRPWLTPDEPPLRTGAYRKEVRHIRLRDGGTAAMEVEVHPDPRVQRYMEQVREAELVQALDRVRAIYNPRTIVVLTRIVLDVTVDCIASWETLSRDVAKFYDLWEETGVLPTAPRDLHAARPQAFASPDAARKAAGRVRALASGIYADPQPMDLLLGVSPPSVAMRYRRPGTRGANAWSTAHVGPRLADPVAALEALVGPVLEVDLPEEAAAAMAIAAE